MKLIDKVKIIDIDKIYPYINNPKEHPEEQINKIASSIKNFGFTVPIIIDEDFEIIAGHGRYKAAKKLELVMSNAKDVMMNFLKKMLQKI
jgi:ParB-like chromosome segregation protein Spo0J